MLDPNPLDEEGSIGRVKVSACFRVKIDVVTCSMLLNLIDYSAVFVVLSLTQCRN